VKHLSSFITLLEGKFELADDFLVVVISEISPPRISASTSVQDSFKEEVRRRRMDIVITDMKLSIHIYILERSFSLSFQRHIIYTSRNKETTRIINKNTLKIIEKFV
jgi:hypothetical protein